MDGHPPIELSKFIGFSELNTGAYTSATSDVILTPADSFSMIYADSAGSLVLDRSQSPGARLMASWPGTVTLTATTVIGEVGSDATIPDQADDRLSMTLSNRFPVR